MTETSGQPQADRRYWHQTIAAKLLLAFALIAVLTAIAAMVAVVQFGRIEDAMSRLTGSSLPAVKYSLAVETNARAIAAGGAQLATAATEVDHFTRMSEATERIGNLWSALSQLRATTGETDATSRLQGIIAGIDQRLGELDRAVREKVSLASSIEHATAQITELTSALTTRLSGLDMQDPALIRPVGSLRAEAYLAAGILHQASNAASADVIRALKGRFAAARGTMTAAVQELRTALPGNARVDEVEKAAQALFALGEGNRNLFDLRAQEIAGRQASEKAQASLNQAAGDMEQLVATIVSGTEQAAARTTDRTASALDNTRFWLLGISLLSLSIAVLIVWFFVIRYIIARLGELTRSMKAVAAGSLNTPIPQAGPDELGDMSRALIVFRDNAREIRNAREEAEHARHQAEAASRTKSAFLANMSHELRTPLNAIIGYSEILREDAVDRGDTASQADLVKIETAGKHLLGLINDILDLSKIEAGRMDLHLENVDLDRLIAEVRMLVAPLVEKNGNILKVDVSSDIGAMRVDMVKLKQSLINLLSNAAKFTKDGTITLAIARGRMSDGGDAVRFTVRDTGIGMSQEQMGRLFQAFTQADATTTRNYGGTGLGLTITKHFCTMLGGTIDVASEPGKGSVFTMTLPDGGSDAAPAAAADMTQASGGASGKTVLIVDDDPTVHDVLRVTLAKEGYRLLHAHDGAAGLALARKDPPDVITLDVMMPKLDGWTVLGKLKSDPALSDIPVIMLTIVDERTMGFSLGAAEYMTKPVDRTRLVELLRRFAGETRKASVLIVDDDADVRAVVRATVEKTGLRTFEAESGQAALDWLATNPPPALVLLDLMMPVMDGFEFLDRMKNDTAIRDIPVVVLTAKELTESERRIVNERTMLVLTKGAQPLSSLGSALSAIARQPARKAIPVD